MTATMLRTAAHGNQIVICGTFLTLKRHSFSGSPNLPWILANGLHCRNSNRFDSEFVSICNADLIANRHYRAVPVSPGGSLSDYIPFYFTPLSMMSYNIKTGYRGIRQRSNEEIVI